MKTPNIIILSNDEDIIRWLDPDLCDIEEINAANKCRKITLTYPYEDEIVNGDEVQWYEQGNKIYIPEINGVSSCLYVINTEYQIDFWKENTVTVEAEEVLTELNYDVISFKSGSVITITEEKLDEWFGSYYTITRLDALASNRKQISPEGVMTRMSLLRLIEEQTERTFITAYYNEESNKINRDLALVDINTVEFTAQTETLDLNYNLESLEFSKDEENTYNAIAPLISPNNAVTGADVENMTNAELGAYIVRNAENNTNPTTAQGGKITISVPAGTQNMSNEDLLALFADYLGTNTDSTGDDGATFGDDTTGNTGTTTTPAVTTGMTTKTYDELLAEWLKYEVVTGQEIPMIIKQDEQGNTVVASTWYAPFTKNRDELYIYDEGEGQANYNSIKPYDRTKSPPKYKIATMTTSEQLVQSIYNDLAVSLLAKLAPKFELKIDVKDIQLLLGLDSLGYQLHEKLDIRVPNFNYFVPCRIVETKKNLHLPGENTIKVETDVTSIVKLYTSYIDSNDMIISTYDNNLPIGGILYGNDDGGDTPLEDKTVTVTIKLRKVYSTGISNVNTQQIIQKFDPVNETYTFTDEEIQRVSGLLRNEMITMEGVNIWDKRIQECRMRDINGVVYSVPRRWVDAIYATRNQIYINNEQRYGGMGSKGLGHGYFDQTIQVHYYPDARTLIYEPMDYEERKKYYPSSFYIFEEYDIKTHRKNNLPDMYFIGSDEIQNGETCVPAACSNITSWLYNYYTEAELAKLMGTTDSGTSLSSAEKILKQLGFNVRIVEATQENVIRYLNYNNFILLGIYPHNLQGDDAEYNHIYEDANEYHVVALREWVTGYNGASSDWMYVDVRDTNIAYMNPANVVYKYENWVPYMSWTNVLNPALCTYYDGTNWHNSSELHTTQKRHMLVIGGGHTQKVDVEDVQGTTITLTEFNPALKNYYINVADVETAIVNAFKSNLANKDNSNVMTMYSETVVYDDTTTTVKNKYSISLYWLRAAYLAYLHSLMSTTYTTKTSPYNAVKINGSSTAMRYYEHMDIDTSNIGVYDWFTPCKVTDEKLKYGYTISTLLFNLGFAYSFNDFTGSDGSFENIINTIKNHKVCKQYLNTWIIQNKAEEISKYLHNEPYDSFHYTVILGYAKDTELNNSTSIRQTSYPVMLYRLDNNTVYYQNLLGNGNNPTDNYDVTSATANNNPYASTTLNKMVEWITATDDEAPRGSSNQLLVISWHKQTDYGGQG